jgi:hypothetical protein
MTSYAVEGTWTVGDVTRVLGVVSAGLDGSEPEP